jgi:DNA-binding IclR family transcriptional regulator
MDVKSAGRTVDLFEIFAAAKRPLTLSELSRALNAPQSSCFNLVRALEARGYLYSVGGNKRLYPTRKLLDCAMAIQGFDPIVPRIQPFLDEIRNASGETVILGTWHGDQVIYLAVSEGLQTIRYISRPGELKPIHASAIGKALLLALPAEKRAELVAHIEFKQITDATIVSPRQLLEEVAMASVCGYTKTLGEGVADVSAVAGPVQVDGVQYAIAIAGPSGRVSPLQRQLGEGLLLRLRALE